MAEIAVSLGFSTTFGIIHDGNGQLQPLRPLECEVYEKLRKIGNKSFARFNRFQENIAYGNPNRWSCRAGARYLYICKDGLVHYCSQQRGYPAIPLAEYTKRQVRREFFTSKPCAPYCTVSCVQQVAMIDNWRAPQTSNPPGRHDSQLVQLESKPPAGQEALVLPASLTGR